MEHQPLIDFLKCHAIISNQEEVNIRKYFHSSFLKKNEIIQHTHTPCKKLFFVKKGLLRAFYINDKGKLFTRMIAWENRFLTNMVSFKGFSDNIETFECLEDAEVLGIDQQGLEQLLKKSVTLKNIYCSLLEEYSAMHLKRFHIFSAADIGSRIQFLKTDYPQLLGRVNDSILASFLCISRETFVRHKSKLFK